MEKKITELAKNILSLTALELVELRKQLCELSGISENALLAAPSGSSSTAQAAPAEEAAAPKTYKLVVKGVDSDDKSKKLKLVLFMKQHLVGKPLAEVMNVVEQIVKGTPFDLKTDLPSPNDPSIEAIKKSSEGTGAIFAVVEA